jgi:ABC-2 type transport system permease protein
VFPVTGIIGYILILITVAFFGLAWSGISLALGLRTKSAETVFGIAGTLTFPLLFMSTALVQQGLMPTWMQNVSAYNPISFAVNAIRDLIMTGYVWNSFSEAYGVISLIAILTLGATFYEFRKVVS